MPAHEGELVAFAAFDGVGHRRTADRQLGVLDARQQPELPQLGHEFLLVLSRYTGTEPKQHYGSVGINRRKRQENALINRKNRPIWRMAMADERARQGNNDLKGR
ncbi:hypothetical protein SPI_01452 [Niveomyces insectorum RCEF 264]|uniref:Uncharacterized protein n=1 Tax=Niveomyces insectorum RCEF 264 TaxID=1081102 RepID=A0A167YZ83_9HYPO|nr:hypothetical protein SPI_01452 [Niveomyces insectorum RCEF 264]